MAHSLEESKKRPDFGSPLSSSEFDALSLSLSIQNSESTEDMHNNRQKKLKAVAEAEGSGRRTTENENAVVLAVPENGNNEEQVPERIKYGVVSVPTRNNDYLDRRCNVAEFRVLLVASNLTCYSGRWGGGTCKDLRCLSQQSVRPECSKEGKTYLGNCAPLLFIGVEGGHVSYGEMGL